MLRTEEVVGCRSRTQVAWGKMVGNWTDNLMFESSNVFHAIWLRLRWALALTFWPDQFRRAQAEKQISEWR